MYSHFIEVRLDAVGKRFDSVRALDSVSTRIGGAGGTVGILGPNGAGKTTLLRCIGTALTPDTGSVFIDGLDVADRSNLRRVRKSLGLMPQDSNLYPDFRVEEFLDYVAILKEIVNRRDRAKQVSKVIEEVQLTKERRKKVKALSGGMKRRLLLAQALIGEPRLLILDEPTAGLDPEQRLRFRELISQLGETRTVLLSTHQTDDVAACCQAVVVLSKGRIIFEGGPGALTSIASGRVWLTAEKREGARVQWRTPDGHYRFVGSPGPGDSMADATIEDGYLLVLGAAGES